jgi:hypothetical protein
MKKLLTVCMLVVLFAPTANAQDGQPDPSKVLAPYVDEYTYVVGIVDLQNVGVEALLDRLATVGMPKAEVAKIKQFALATRQDLLNAGGRHVCFTMNLDDRFDDGPLLVVPAAKGKAQAVADVLGKVGVEAKVKGDVVLAGKAKTIERAMERKASAVPQLATALAAVDALPSRMAMVVPPAFRKSLEELMPKLPKELGGGGITPVTRGLSWSAVGVDLSAEKLQLKAIVQAKDVQAATDLGRLAGRAIDALRQQAGKENAPELARGLQVLRPDVKDDQLRLTLDIKTLDAAIMPLLPRMRGAAAREQSSNNLKQFALAMHNYYSIYKSFPAQASYGKGKKPLLSWRVHLLPFVEQTSLYKQFKLDEPWDSPNNKPLIAKMPTIFRSPLSVNVAPGKTTYLVPVGPDLIFDGPKKTKMAQITDGTSNTIFIVDADDSRAVWWTQPEDYKVDRKKPKAGLVRPGASTFLAAFADGSVRAINGTIRDERLWLFFHPSDGMPIPND